MRTKQSYNNDLQLLYAWECPSLFKDICKQYNEFSIDNKILNLKFKDYKTVIQIPTNEREIFEFLLKLKKNTRSNGKSLSITIQKPKTDFINKFENIYNSTTNDQTMILENIKQSLYIDYKTSKSEDIFFELKSLNNLIDFSSISLIWIIPHFKDQTLYLNGQNEIQLRIKLSNLLIGNNEIICDITNIKTNQTFKKIYNFSVERNPYGGNCLVSPNSGISMYTNFTITQEGWKGGSLPLLFKIMCKTNSNILIDLTNGGFFTQSFSINNLPEGNNIIFLEVSDNQGKSVLAPCPLKINKNNSKPPIETYLENLNDITRKMVLFDIYTLNKDENTKNQDDEKKEIDYRLNILNTYYEEISFKFDHEKFFENIEKVLSFLLEFSYKNLKNIDLGKLFDILDLIINNIDPLLDEMNKINILYEILDNFSENIKIKIKENSGNKLYYINL